MSEIEKYYNGEIHVDFDDEIERLKNEIEMKDFDIEAIKREVENRDMYINELEKAYCKELERLHNIIKEVREYIENNNLYEQDYDYDYEENLVVGPPSDETARKILLEILDKTNQEYNS